LNAERDQRSDQHHTRVGILLRQKCGFPPFARKKNQPTAAHRCLLSVADGVLAGPWVSYKRHRMQAAAQTLHLDSEPDTSALHRCRTFDRTSAATLWAISRRQQSQPMGQHGQLQYRCNGQTR
jgi:hypothetical protein